MKLKQVIAELKGLGTDQNCKVYRRHGVDGKMFGVSFANLTKLKKRIKCDHQLALDLWDTDNHDARVLATMIADPQTMTAAQAQRWAKDIGNYVLCDAVGKLIFRTSFATKKTKTWIRARSQWLSTLGWNVLTQLILEGTYGTNSELKQHLVEIERGIGSAPNRTRYSMNNCLIAIGVRNATLKKSAIAAARRIGPVEVDHFETGCKTPDAESYIEKTAAHRQRKSANSKPTKKKSTKKVSRKLSAAHRSPSEHGEAIIAMIQQIPPGKVATYGQIAALAGVPKNARQVGSILKSHSDVKRLPWFRVVNSKGEISVRSTTQCQNAQQELLEDEGIEFSRHGRVSLSKFQWKPESFTPIRRTKK